MEQWHTQGGVGPPTMANGKVFIFLKFPDIVIKTY